MLLDRPQFPDVVGDRKLVRFLRGHEHNVDKVCEMVTNFLKWRDDNNMDEVRERIIRGGLNHPRSFPLGEKILQLIPQVASHCCVRYQPVIHQLPSYLSNTLLLVQLPNTLY